VGVEEELMLVDPETGRLTAVAERALRVHADAEDPVKLGTRLDDSGVEAELFLQQIETTTPPCDSMNELDRQLRAARRTVGTLAFEAGAAVVAVPTPVLIDADASVTPRPRYQRIREEFGELAKTSLACAMHIHVGLEDGEDGATLLGDIGPWLPVLLAISANSPYWRGQDTGYASWRTQIWTRWPSNGTGQRFDSREEYDEVARRLIEWGAALDEGMVYFDARLSRRFPTVEIRVADVCTDPEDAILFAALARALVTTAASCTAAGQRSNWRSDLLRAASWRASRYGLAERLVDPATLELAQARAVIESLVRHVRSALEETDDLSLVLDLVERLFSRGGGATRQRRAFETDGSLEAVVADLRARTEESWTGYASWVHES
jgi:glutamate---cysteine ligase / carboxylate-amine ligase